MPSPVAAAAYVQPPATLRPGATGALVQTLQGRLNAHGASLKVDGDFGPATLAALVAFQKSTGLAGDGICGPMSWRALA
ncbi:peptidoglycan-binding domain-containing protein [Bradyrhizobium diazoefficiens]